MLPLEKETATHSSVLAWRTPGTGEPGGLPSMGSHRFGHDSSDLAAAGVASEPSQECLPCFRKSPVGGLSVGPGNLSLFCLSLLESHGWRLSFMVYT